MTDNIIDDARAYFRGAHDSIGHTRKYTNTPYWHHTEEVAKIVSGVTDDSDMIIAALGHDCLEDVFPVNEKYSFEDIVHNFGERAAFMIRQLTDIFTKESYPHLNREKRKSLERLRMEGMWPESKTIKLADLISNTKDICKYDEGFARVYLKEKMQLLPFLEGGNKELLNRAYEQCICSGFDDM